MTDLVMYPTAIPAHSRALFMVYGDEHHVLGVTDRLTLSHGACTVRLTMDLFEKVTPYVLVQDGDCNFHLADHFPVGLSLRVWQRPKIDLAKGFLGTWNMPIGTAGFQWLIESTHAGYVPCHGCLAPREESSVARNDACACGKESLGLMPWWRLQNLFNFADASARPRHVTINPWRKVLGIGGNSD